MRSLKLPALAVAAATAVLLPLLSAGPAAAASDAPTATGPSADCARWAGTHARGHNWLCVGSGLTQSWSDGGAAHRTYTDVHTARTVDVTGLGEQATARAVASTAPATGDLQASALGGTDTLLAPSARIDDYHAKNTEYVYWNINNHAGKTNFSYSIGISNHSANVDMSYFETSGVGIKLTWRLRLRHDISFGSDTTLFTYPNVEGPYYYTQSYSEHEDRYGDGYNTMPYQTDWKVFWDSYNLNLVYGGTAITAAGTVQSDRATCYKTVSCKFK